MAKSKTKRPPPKRPATFTPPKAASKSWLWWAGLAAVVLLGVGVIVVARKGSDVQRGNEPQGTETVAVQARGHVQGAVNYDRTPPAGGDHSGTILNCGVYDQPVPSENAVHSMEHGAVWVTYRPDLPADQVARVKDTVKSRYRGSGRYAIVSPFPGIPSPVVASAWVAGTSPGGTGKQLKLDNASDPRLGEFLDRFVQATDALEPGGTCQGGVGRPTE